MCARNGCCCQLILVIESSRQVEGSQTADFIDWTCIRMPKAPCHCKKVFARRALTFKLQVEALHLLHVGGVEHDQGRGGAVDLPSVNLGGRVWLITWVFYGIFIHFPLG